MLFLRITGGFSTHSSNKCGGNWPNFLLNLFSKSALIQRAEDSSPPQNFCRDCKIYDKKSVLYKQGKTAYSRSMLSKLEREINGCAYMYFIIPWCGRPFRHCIPD
jgi:hypothetical protein